MQKEKKVTGRGILARFTHDDNSNGPRYSAPIVDQREALGLAPRVPSSDGPKLYSQASIGLSRLNQASSRKDGRNSSGSSSPTRLGTQSMEARPSAPGILAHQASQQYYGLDPPTGSPMEKTISRLRESKRTSAHAPGHLSYGELASQSLSQDRRASAGPVDNPPARAGSLPPVKPAGWSTVTQTGSRSRLNSPRTMDSPRKSAPPPPTVPSLPSHLSIAAGSDPESFLAAAQAFNQSQSQGGAEFRASERRSSHYSSAGASGPTAATGSRRVSVAASGYAPTAAQRRGSTSVPALAPGAGGVAGGEQTNRRGSIHAGEGSSGVSADVIPPYARANRRASIQEAREAMRRQSVGPALAGLSAEEAKAAMVAEAAALRAEQGPHWQGEDGKRFMMLRGSRMIRETELRVLHSIYLEVHTMSDGEINLAAVRVYMTKLNPRNASRLRLAASLCENLEKVQLTFKQLTFDDFVRVSFPTATHEERDFLAQSAHEFHGCAMKKTLADTGTLNDLIRMYAPPEKGGGEFINPDVIKATKVFHMLDKKGEGFVPVDLVVQSIRGADLSLPEKMIRKQLTKIVPDYVFRIDKENFLRFIMYHLANGPPSVNMTTWCDVLEGYQSVLSRYIHGSDSDGDA